MSYLMLRYKYINNLSLIYFAIKKLIFTAISCHNFYWSFSQFYYIEQQSSFDEVHTLARLVKDQER